MAESVAVTKKRQASPGNDRPAKRVKATPSPEPEPEPSSESDSQPDLNPESELELEPESDLEPDSEPESDAWPDFQSVAEVDPEESGNARELLYELDIDEELINDEGDELDEVANQGDQEVDNPPVTSITPTTPQLEMEPAKESIDFSMPTIKVYYDKHDRNKGFTRVGEHILRKEAPALLNHFGTTEKEFDDIHGQQNPERAYRAAVQKNNPRSRPARWEEEVVSSDNESSDEEDEGFRREHKWVAPKTRIIQHVVENKDYATPANLKDSAESKDADKNVDETAAAPNTRNNMTTHVKAKDDTISILALEGIDKYHMNMFLSWLDKYYDPLDNEPVLPQCVPYISDTARRVQIAEYVNCWLDFGNKWDLGHFCEYLVKGIQQEIDALRGPGSPFGAEVVNKVTEAGDSLLRAFMLRAMDEDQVTV